MKTHFVHTTFVSIQLNMGLFPVSVECNNKGQERTCHGSVMAMKRKWNGGNTRCLIINGVCCLWESHHRVNILFINSNYTNIILSSNKPLLILAWLSSCLTAAVGIPLIIRRNEMKCEKDKRKERAHAFSHFISCGLRFIYYWDYTKGQRFPDSQAWVLLSKVSWFPSYPKSSRR